MSPDPRLEVSTVASCRQSINSRRSGFMIGADRDPARAPIQSTAKSRCRRSFEGPNSVPICTGSLNASCRRYPGTADTPFRREVGAGKNRSRLHIATLSSRGLHSETRAPRPRQARTMWLSRGGSDVQVRQAILGVLCRRGPLPAMYRRLYRRPLSRVLTEAGSVCGRPFDETSLDDAAHIFELAAASVPDDV